MGKSPNLLRNIYIPANKVFENLLYFCKSFWKLYYENGLTFCSVLLLFVRWSYIQWGQRETKNGNVKRLSETFCSKTISSSSYFKSDWALILPHIVARCIISLTKYFQVVRFYSLSYAHVFFFRMTKMIIKNLQLIWWDTDRD